MVDGKGLRMRNTDSVEDESFNPNVILGHPITTSLYLTPMVASYVEHYTDREINPISTYKGFTILSLEETLLDYLKESNYLSHFVVPFLLKWGKKLNLTSVFERLEPRLHLVLASFLHLAQIPYKEWVPFVARTHRKSDTYPSYLSKISLDSWKSNNLSFDKVKDKLEIIKLDWNVELFLTQRDIKKTSHEKDYLSIDRREMLNHLRTVLQEIHHFCEIEGITYGIGGGMGLFLGCQFESSTDIDVVVIGENLEDKLNSLYNFFTSTLQYLALERLEGYMSFQSKDGNITIDVEINQHYKQLVNHEIEHRLQKVIWHDICVSIVHHEDILRLKKQFGRLKDLNNILKLISENPDIKFSL